MDARKISHNFRKYIISLAAAILFIKTVMFLETYAVYFTRDEGFEPLYAASILIGMLTLIVIYIAIFFFMDKFFVHHKYKRPLLKEGIQRLKIIGGLVAISSFVHAFTISFINVIDHKNNFNFWLESLLRFNYLTFATGLFIIALCYTTSEK
ncbi:MAG: hypothetical protein ACI9TY_000978 [Alphaproteobacteria bacterium]|jgi:hypothetical protein